MPGVKMPIPNYMNCNNEEFQHCDYLIHSDCPGTCTFYKDIGGIGVGALMKPVGLEDNISDEYGNMKYVNNELNPSYNPQDI